MSVAVAHQISAKSNTVLTEAVREAAVRRCDLVVIHVTESLDLDLAEAQRRGLSADVARIVAENGIVDLGWEIRLATGDDIAAAVVELTASIGAQLLVIGARRRSPVGKALLGSAAQNIILDATVPVLVVKPT